MRIFSVLFILLFLYSCSSDNSQRDKYGKTPSDVLNDFLLKPYLAKPVKAGSDIQYARDKGYYSKAREALLFKNEYINKYGFESLKDYKFFFALPDYNLDPSRQTKKYSVIYEGDEAAIYFVPARRYIHFKLIDNKWHLNDRLGAKDNLKFGRIFWAEQRLLLKKSNDPEHFQALINRKNNKKAEMNSGGDGPLIKSLFSLQLINVAMKDKDLLSQSPTENALKLLTYLAHDETEKSKSFGNLVRLLFEQCIRDLDNCAPEQKSLLIFALAQYNNIPQGFKLYNALEKHLPDFLELCMNNKFDDGSVLLNFSFQTAALLSLKGIFKDDVIREQIEYRKQLLAKLKLNVEEDAFSSFYRANYLFNCAILNIDYEESLLVNANLEVFDQDHVYLWLITVSNWYKGGDFWRKFNRKMSTYLVNKQHKDGYWYEDLSLLSSQALNIQNANKEMISTTMAALSLTVYYRYLRLYKSGLGGKSPDGKVMIPEENLDLVE